MNIPLISTICVEKLFGLYAYRLPNEGELSSASILYGDNGVGKSTILRLVFHLLSSASDKGHRKALFVAPFESLEVTLSNGVRLEATRPEVDDAESFINDWGRDLRLSIFKDGVLLGRWDFNPEKPRGAEGMYLTGRKDLYRTKVYGSKVSSRNYAEYSKAMASQGRLELGDDASNEVYGELAYITALEQNVPTMFILNADRRLDSDAVSDPGDEIEFRQVMRYEEPKRINDLVVRSREIALSQALGSAAKWVSGKAVQSANLGTENVHSVYVNVVKHLVSTSKKKAEGGLPNTDDLLKMLAEVELKSNELAIYELAAPLSIVELKKSLTTRSKAKRDLAAGFLKPYVESLKGRIEAVDPIYNVLHRFVKIVNDFLVDKKIEYKVSRGFNIVSSLGVDLTPNHLSSGEQQLLLLFCYVLTGRDKPCVFMIDEPEISLNVKWQRKLVKTLLDITEGANIQFVFASHSIELLTQHRNRVVKLVNTNV
ncbi:AAA family ATPase [Pseudomonas sp. SB113]|uniref:AAA family ATPase n=1 Tax=Pseudomonas sp. SB113 TaxID=3154123 RepID=UPI00345D73D1